MQFTTEWLLPTRIFQDDSIGDTAWNDLEELLVNDLNYDTFSFVNLSGTNLASMTRAHLVINDTIITANDEISANDDYPFGVVGSSSSIWGASSLSGEEVKNKKFGVAFGMARKTISGSVYADKAHYVAVMGFNPDIPDNATIDGIELRFDAENPSTGGGTDTVKFNKVEVRFTYTWDVEINAEASSFGGIFIDPPNRELPQKKHRFKVRSPSGDYLGDWRDLSSDPTYKQDLNNIIGSMPLSFARNDLSIEPTVEELLNQDDSVLTNEDDSPFLIDVTPVSALGEGTNLDTNYDVEVDAIYGQFEPLLNEDDTPILNEDGSMILVEEGYPLGRTIFRGYVPRWELPLSGSGITSEIRSYSQDLANELFLSEDTPYITNSTLDGGSIGIAGSGPTDIFYLAQSFSMAAQKTVSKVRLFPNAGWYSDVPFSVNIVGGTPSSPGANFGSGIGTVNRNTLVDSYDVIFTAPITLPIGTYHFVFDTTEFKTGGNPTYPVNFSTSTAYGGGSLWYETNDTGLVNATGSDIAFILYEAGAETTVPFLSQDPSDILRAIVDFARDRGYPINYTADSIQDTGTTVSYTFRGQTVKEAIEKVLELCPANWYYYYDFGTDTIYLREKSATPDRWLRKGQTVIDGKIIKTIEQVVNDAPFTGGGDPSLYIRETDFENVGTTTRKGLKKLSDNRVTDESTARILANSEIENFKDPLYAGDVIIAEDGTFYLEDVAVGEVYGFIGFGSLVDAIIVQGVSKDYSPDKMPIVLTYNLPKVNKRVEDIKRNLDTLETTNNPDEPS